MAAQLEDAGRERIGGGEGGCVEVEDLLVGASVEGRVDVDELWRALVGAGGYRERRRRIPPSGE